MSYLKRLKKIFIGDPWIWGSILFLIIYPLPGVMHGMADINIHEKETIIQTEGEIPEAYYFTPEVSIEYNLTKHLAFIVVSLILMVFIANFVHKQLNLPSKRNVELFLKYTLIASWFALIGVMIFGTEINESKRWIFIFGISIQVSEISKVILVLLAAYTLHYNQGGGRRPDKRQYRTILILTIITCFLIFLEDFSMAALIFMTIFAIMFAGRVPSKYWRTLVLSGIAIATIGITLGHHIPFANKRAPTWQKRIYEMYHVNVRIDFSEDSKPDWIKEEKAPQLHTQEDGKQVLIKSNRDESDFRRNAIIEAGFWGVNPIEKTPQDEIKNITSDFILTLIILHRGYLGSLLIVIAYLIILIRTQRIIIGHSEMAFSVLLGVATSIAFTIQAFTHIGVNSFLFPSTGQPLPLVSVGGTAMLTQALLLGVLLAVSHQAHIDKKNKTNYEAAESSSIEGIAHSSNEQP